MIEIDATKNSVPAQSTICESFGKASQCARQGAGITNAQNPSQREVEVPKSTESHSFDSFNEAMQCGKQAAETIDPKNPPRYAVEKRGGKFKAMVFLNQPLYPCELVEARCAVLYDPRTKRPICLEYTAWDAVECDFDSGSELYVKLNLKKEIICSRMQPT